jgi:hypothetical protein
MARRSLLVAPYAAGLVGFGWSGPSTPPPPAESASSTPIAATRRQIRMIIKARMSQSPSFSHRCPLRRPRGCQRLARPIRFGSTLFPSCTTAKPGNPGPINHRRGARWMPAMVHRTEPPAISIVGMDSGTRVALWAINAIWDGSSASYAVCDSASRRPSRP